MRIIFIIGSLRRNSFNRALAENAAAIIGERAEISFLEYQDIPYMNQDIEYPAEGFQFFLSAFHRSVFKDDRKISNFAVSPATNA